MSAQQRSSDLEYARQLQEKFELYLIALVFTLLGLAAQTATFGKSDVADTLELLAWVGLLVSGLVGLSRLEWVPVTLKTHAELLTNQNEHQALSEAAAQGTHQVQVQDHDQPMDIVILIADRTAAIERDKDEIKKLQQLVLLKYRVHKWSFVLALCLLVAARAASPAEALAKKHLTLFTGTSHEFKRQVIDIP